uniref:non-specific serine/threonine protein kinase n=1 Tax=Steinernema glaseri TaxID=37863 RepID=A0A1I7ZW43_9BILA
MNAADNNEKSSSDEVSWAPSTHSRQRPQSKFYGDSTDESTTSDSDSTGSSSQSEDRNKERDDGDCEIFFKSSSSSDSDDGSEQEDSDTESSQSLLPLVPAMPEFKNNFESFTVYIVMGLCRQSLEDYLQKRNNSLRPTVNLMDAYSIFEDILSALSYLHEDGLRIIHRDIKSLEDYLQKRNNSLRPTVNLIDAYSIFEDILSALSYLHEDGLRIIHRDIKPSNIFLQETPKGIRAILGDFGLACHQERDFSDVVSPSSHCNGDGDHLRTEGVGTIHYAPPEQLSSKHYDCSVDIYSLGLVMYEFFHTAKTAMERVQLLGSIRRTGKVSEQFRSRWGEIGNLIERMVHVDPTQRPSASTILNEMQLTSPKTVKKLKQALRTKDAQIAMLRKRLQDYKDNCTCGFYTTGR